VRGQLSERSIRWPPVIGVRREIITGGKVAPVTLGYSEGGHQDPEVAVPGYPVPGRPGQSGASAGPTETPQLRDTVADPHRNPTDETAHSGTLVMRVKVRRTAGDQRRCA
jgi:hypothetical protein